MQPMGGEEQKKANGFVSGGFGLAGNPSGGSNNNNNSSNGTPSKPAEGGALGGMNFNFTPFGQPAGSGGAALGQTAAAGGAGSTPATGAPVKRPSIDESWVNVDWNEVNRNKEIGHAAPAASVLHPPSLGGLSSFTPQKETPSSFGYGGEPGKREASTPSKPVSTAASSSLFNLPKPIAHEKPTPSAHAAPKSPAMKPMTPAKEPVSLKAESLAFAPPKPAPAVGEPKPASTQSPFKSAAATPAKVEKPAPVPTVAAPKISPEPAKSQAATPASAAVAKPSAPPTPAAKPSAPAKAEKDEASTSKTTPKTKTPRKSAQTTPRSSGRTRKTVDRLSPGGAELHHEPKALEIPAGSGAKFGDIPHIAKELGKRKSDHQPIVTLHRIIFGRPGEAAKRKGDLRSFHGMAVGEDMAKIAEKLSHHQVDELREICGLLNLEHSGEKKTLAERIAKYLIKPMDLGESKPSPRRATPQKRGRASPAPAKKGKRGKTSGGSGKAATGKATEQEEEGGAESGSEGDDVMIADLEEGQEGAVATQ